MCQLLEQFGAQSVAITAHTSCIDNWYITYSMTVWNDAKTEESNEVNNLFWGGGNLRDRVFDELFTITEQDCWCIELQWMCIWSRNSINVLEQPTNQNLIGSRLPAPTSESGGWISDYAHLVT